MYLNHSLKNPPKIKMCNHYKTAKPNGSLSHPVQIFIAQLGTLEFDNHIFRSQALTFFQHKSCSVELKIKQHSISTAWHTLQFLHLQNMHTQMTSNIIYAQNTVHIVQCTSMLYILHKIILTLFS